MGVHKCVQWGLMNIKENKNEKAEMRKQRTVVSKLIQYKKSTLFLLTDKDCSIMTDIVIHYKLNS